MKIVFFGTPDYVVPILDLINKKLKTGNEPPVVAVVTQKPKPTGRKQLLEYSAVDTWAHKRKVPTYFDPKKIVEDRVDTELGILASYGAIIPKETINYFKYGIINIHPSLLPKFRGSSPVQATIVTGEQPGTTIIKIDELLDHGPIVTQFKEDAKIDDTTKLLRDRLFERAAEVIVSLIPAYLAGKVNIKSQKHDEATFTKQIRKEDAYIKPKYISSCLRGKSLNTIWSIPFIKDYTTIPTPGTIERFIRAMSPWPIAWTQVKLSPKDKEPKRLKLLRAHTTKSTNQNSQLILDKVQLEGKTPVSWKQFKEGYTTATFL